LGFSLSFKSKSDFGETASFLLSSAGFARKASLMTATDTFRATSFILSSSGFTYAYFLFIPVFYDFSGNSSFLSVAGFSLLGCFSSFGY
jgi:hypothetical protein